MVDIDFLSQLVNSMADAAERMAEAIERKDSVEANRLRVFVFDLHKKFNSAFGGER